MSRFSKARSMTVTLGVTAFILISIGCGSTRAGYETAGYEEDMKDGSFSTREYKAMTLASTEMKTERSNGSFMRLFRYIDGGNESEQKIAMTTPVFTQPGEKMSFVLPEKDQDNPPGPASEQVEIERQPAYTAAVVRFNGYARKDSISKQTKRLKEWMENEGLVATGEAIAWRSMTHRGPRVPHAKNEIIIPIRSMLGEMPLR